MRQFVIYLILSIKYFHIKTVNLLRHIHWFFFRKDYSNQYHLELLVSNGRPHFHCYTHHEYVLYKTAELSRLQANCTPTEFIHLALKESIHCNFIIFSCGERSRYVQFWLGDGDYVLSWPLLKGNRLSKYLYAMLGVLNELNITQHPVKVGWYFSSTYRFYTVNYSEGFPDYRACFAKNTADVSTFVSTVFTEVFKQDLASLTFEIG